MKEEGDEHTISRVRTAVMDGSVDVGVEEVGMFLLYMRCSLFSVLLVLQHIRMRDHHAYGDS